MAKKILLIDDDVLVLKTISNLLQSHGYQVVGCKSGDEGIEKFKNERFNLIVADVRLPGKDGIETVRRMREIESRQEISITPVIMITGYASEDKPIQAIKLNVRDYILKPFDNNVLLKSIESCLKATEEISDTRDIFHKCRAYTRAEELKVRESFPYFCEVERIEDNHVIMQGKRKIMLGGNNYLGAANHPILHDAFKTAVAQYGVGSTGSRLVSGNFNLYKRLEKKIADFFDREDALIFNTGYQGNLGTISSLVGRHEYLVIDSEAHASIVDGGHLSFSIVKRFSHDDMQELEQILTDLPRGKVLVAVDGVYSMEGDIADLPNISALCKKYEARLLVDEAHAFGVFGKSGQGVTEHFSLDKEIDLVTATFSKSCGVLGGFVTGKQKIIDFIRHTARSILFSTGVPAAILSAAEAGFDHFVLDSLKRQKLWENTELLRSGLKKLGLNLGRSASPIIPIILGDPFVTLNCWKALYDKGIFVGAMITPAVPPNKCLLRMSCSACLTKEDIEYVLEQCKEILQPNLTA